MTDQCPSAAQLRGLVDGSLSDSEADSLQLHIERCETCQNALQEIVADGDFWQSAAQNLSDDEAAGPGLERIVDELQHQSPEDAEEMGEAIELKLSFIDPPTEPGTIGRLKHYDILRVAGRGGMGIVLKAFDRTLRRVVAVKMLAPHLAGNGQARQRFVREGRAAAGICHEHVVTIHAVEESPPFIVMQYVQGETLEGRIHRNGSLEIREAMRIAKQIAQGLAAAHTQGVVHRDIKPANILLENGVARVRITDFGLARAVDDASLTQSGVVAGTPQYMAPEQANGDAVDERADLFSLGSVLYTMLAGHAPFRATTTMGVLKRLCDNTARPIREINPDVPDWLVIMINRLHAKRPADRYQSAQDVADVLERGLASLQNGASPTVEFPAVDISSVATEAAGLESAASAAPAAAVRDDTFAPGAAASLGLASAPLANIVLPGWTIRVPFWLVAIPLVLVALGPLGQEAAAIATFSLIGLCFFGMLAYFVNKLLGEPDPSDEYDSSGPKDRSAGGRSRWLAFRLREVTPSSWTSKLGWLVVWCLPVVVWTMVLSIQEEWVWQMDAHSLDDRERDILITLGGIVCLWWLIAIVWFRRKRPDGSQLFERGRWKRVLMTLGLAVVFCMFGYDVWRSDVYRLTTLRAAGQPRNHRISFGATVTEAVAAPSVRVEFETAADGLEVVINFAGGRHVTLTPVHHRVMVQISEQPGIYEWRAMLKGEHVASGEVALIAGEMVDIKVPRPKLSQLIAGRWESDPKQQAVDWGSLDGEDADLQIELEFENDLATLAIGQSGQVERSQFSVRIDESVTPALIDLLVPDEPQMTGIVKFQAGPKSHYQMRSPYMMSPIVPGETEMTMTAESMQDGPEYLGAAPAEGGTRMGMGFGNPGIATASEPDRLLICVSDGAGLRPWEFQADEERGHMIFALVRSRESGSLREKMALEPVQLATPHDLTIQSVQAWSKRLKIEAEGTNSVGMEMVLVPPAAYHLVDPPHLSKLRRELPEPSPVREVPNFKYEFPSKLKQQITKRQKVVSYPFVMSRRTVTVEQFRQFIDETGYVTDAERGTLLRPEFASPLDTKGGWRREGGLFNWADRLSWKNPISADEEVKGLDRPVAVISWRDATEFCKWLSKKKGRQYRLPKNEEWTAAMQLGAAHKPIPATDSDDPMLNDYYGWFDATSKHPLGIVRTNETFAEWTQDAQFGSKFDGVVLVHHEESADGVRFYLGTQFVAEPSFRAAEIGFRVVAELQALAVEKSDEEPSDSPRAESSSDLQETHSS
jgi:serine/threonine protein kinase/formylglycine-generating enzyme required for sulfatase activity